MMPPPPPQPSFVQLEQAALRILRLVSDTPGLENTTLAVTGDLALLKYLAPRGIPVVRCACDRLSVICADFLIA